MIRLRVVWASIVGFLVLYGFVGAVLVERGTAVPTMRGTTLAVLGAACLALALVLRPILHRAGLHPYPAYVFAWSAAEAVAVCGLVAWVESGDFRAYAVAAPVSFATLLVLFPRAVHDVDPGPPVK